MMNFIWYQASEASKRLENNEWVEDPSIRETLYRKCEPQIIKKWQEIRLEKIAEFNHLFMQLENMINTNMALIVHEPDADLIPLKEQPKGGQKIATVTVTGRTTRDIDKIKELVKKMNNVLSPLEGEKGNVLFLSSRYEMRIDGEEPIKETYKPEIKRYLTYNKIGEHNIKLDHELNLTTLVESEDISRYSRLETSIFEKIIPTKATYSFSVVEDAKLSAKVTVTVKDKTTEKPISGATVYMSVPDGLRMPSKTTDINGITIFSDISMGQYKIFARAQGYDEKDGTLTIDPAKKQEYSGTIWLLPQDDFTKAPKKPTVPEVEKGAPRAGPQQEAYERCVKAAEGKLAAERKAFERWTASGKSWLEAAEKFICCSGQTWWVPHMSEKQKAVFKEVDGREPINKGGQAEAPGCSFGSMKNTEYNRCAWQQYLNKLEVLTRRAIQECEKQKAEAPKLTLPGATVESDCAKRERVRYQDAVANLANVRNPNAFSKFSPGEAYHSMQEVAPKHCSDSYYATRSKLPADEAWIRLQECSWREELAKRKADLEAKEASCSRGAPGTNPTGRAKER